MIMNKPNFLERVFYTHQLQQQQHEIHPQQQQQLQQQASNCNKQSSNCSKQSSNCSSKCGRQQGYWLEKGGILPKIAITWVWSRFLFSSSSSSSPSGGESPTPNKKILGQTNLGVFFFFFLGRKILSLSFLANLFLFTKWEKKKLHQTFVILKRFFGDKK